MTDVFYLRSLEPPATVDAVLGSLEYSGGCFDLHRVDWLHSFLAADGGRMLCWYRAPDAESARLALRELEADLSAVWPGRVLGGVEPRRPEIAEVNSLAEVTLGSSATPGDDELLARLGETEAAGLCFRFAFVSNRRDRLVCLFEDAEAERAREALERVSLSAVTAWRCTVVTPGASA